MQTSSGCDRIIIELIALKKQLFDAAGADRESSTIPDVSIAWGERRSAVIAADRRSYDQYCPLARALDVVGERWSMLIVRDLLGGPKRFKELREGLPGIATNLLTQRLRRLERAGVVRRSQLPPPAGSSVYELTERGRALQPALRELAHWGAPELGRPRRGDSVDLDRLMIAGLGGVLRPRPSPEVREVYEMHIGSEVYAIRVADGEARVSRGSVGTPDLVVRMDLELFLAIVAGTTTSEQAGTARFSGEPEVIRRYLELMRSR